MATVKILVRHIESDNLALMEISDDDPIPTTREALKANGYEVIDNHEDALRRLYHENRRGRPWQGIRPFRPAAAYLRIE